ncbi:MAG: hypothetical protein J3Q66DRAFT_324429 [Benniella sp.]|nr:MAG: hypothetical protein J3Q66DRAFT_324429 [Benniella sp.]
MSDSDDAAPVPRKAQPKPRPRRAVRARTDSTGSPSSKDSTLSPPQARRRIEDDFFSKAKNYREVFKAQESALLSEIAKESVQVPILDPILAIDETPLSDLDDEVKVIKKPSEQVIVVEEDEDHKRKRDISLTPPPELPLECYIIPSKPLPQEPIPTSSIVDLDDDEDDTGPELDPELASIAAKITSTSTPLSPTYSGSGSSQSQRSVLSRATSSASVQLSLSQSGDLGIDHRPYSTLTPNGAAATAAVNGTPGSQSMGLNVSPSLPNMQQTVDIIIRMQRHPLLVIMPEHEAYVNELERFIKVTVRADESFRRMMEWYCELKCIGISTVVFTFRGTRLMPSATPISLEFPSKAIVDVYEQNAFKYVKQQETLERSQRMATLERYAENVAFIEDRKLGKAEDQQQQQRELPLKHSTEGAEDTENTEDATTGMTVAQTQADTEPFDDPETSVEYLHIKLRGKDTADEKIRVKTSTTIFAILMHYKRIKKIPADTLIKLEFDDEAIDPSKKIGETDVEDDDMLFVRIG